MVRLAHAIGLFTLATSLAVASPTDARRRRNRQQPATTTQGGLTAAQVRDVIQANIGAVQACYEAQLAHAPTLAGRVTVAFVIGPSGRVEASTVAANDTGNEPLGTCIADAVKRWRFPQPVPAGPVSVRFPFNLSQSTR